MPASFTDTEGGLVTYVWEEYDLGVPSPPEADGDVSAALFRSYNPSLNPSRVFPSMFYVLNNGNNPPSTYGCTDAAGNAFNCVPGELLPTMTQTMTFRMTAWKAHRVASIILNEPSNWHDASNSADLAIITPRQFFSAAEPLKKTREAQGHKVAIIDIDDIYDEFSFGNKSPNSVRDFLALARSSWKLAPRFVLLAGDSSCDPKNYLGYGYSDVVPTKLIDTAYLETASDDWFADFNGDGIADLSIGRLPVRSAQEASAVVAKLIAYEQAAPSNEVALVADSNDGFDFEQASTSVRSLIPTSLRVSEIFRARSDDATARAQLLAAINRGQKIVNYSGHGAVNAWRGNLLAASDGQHERRSLAAVCRGKLTRSSRCSLGCEALRSRLYSDGQGILCLKARVESLGGELQLVSVEGKGAEITLRIPRGLG